MKFFAIVLLALVAAATANSVLHLNEEQKERLRGFADECRTKVGVTKEQTKHVRDGHFEAIDHPIKCFAHCVLEHVGFISDNTIHSDVIHTKLAPFGDADKLKAVADKCNGVHNDDKCETAFELVRCYYQEKAKIL